MEGALLGRASMNLQSPPLFVDAPADASTLAELMARSWRENAEQPLEYSSEFLTSMLGYPGMTADLAPAVVLDGRPAAWAAGFPRHLCVNGETGRYVLMTFFTVAPEMKGKGLGAAVWAECLRRARAAGFNGALHYCVDGNVSNFVTAAGARAAGFEAARIFTVPYLMRFLRPAPASEVQPVPDEALGFLQESARSLAREVHVARRWSAREADWQLRRRMGACVEWSAEGGLLAGYVMRVADAERTPCLFVDEIHWGALPPQRRAELLSRFLGRAAALARLAVVPLLNYTDMSQFQAAGFRRSPRLLHAFLTPFEGPAPVPASSLYADVL